jgi:hypothetical protein
MSAFAAASAAYSCTASSFGLDARWLLLEPNNVIVPRMIELAAAFLRKWPDNVNPDAIVIHLRRSGFSQVPKPGPRRAIAWKVFAFTLAELDRLDREEAERRKIEAAKNPGRPLGVASREDLTYAPPDNSPRSDLGR